MRLEKQAKGLIIIFFLKIHSFSPVLHDCVLHEALSEADPGHVVPLLVGAGLLQILVWVWIPPPQVTLQTPKADQTPQLPFTEKDCYKIEVRSDKFCKISINFYGIYWPGVHGCALHATLSEAEPEQVSPPFAGAGLLQILVWVTVQAPKTVQDPQLPFTAKVNHNIELQFLSNLICDCNLKWFFLPAVHICVLHEPLSEAAPGQVAPPFAGAGLLQSLVWVWVPPPQATLQAP